jgi:2-polyprenyl-6-methoxyphenol hydroxylase-like FAD-dependent oxidoreductase
MMSYRNPPVVIIGAGVGGLTLALLLRQRGVAAEVLEQSAELREAGAAVGLAANATRVLRFLGLGEDLARVSTEPTRLIHRDGRDGRIVAASRDNRWYRETFGAPFYGLHRTALQRLLAGAFGPEHLHLGCRVEALEESRAGVRVRCASGTAFEAAVVVGADGVHSVARNWVTGGDEPVYSGTSGFRGLVPAERLPSLPDSGALQFWMGPGAHLLHYPIDGGRVVNFLAVIDGPPRWTAPAWLEEAVPGAHLAPFADWHPAVTEMLAAVPQSPRWGLFARRPLAHWNRGPVVLLGDAAHAMLPHQGQGANQTIEDAAVLAAELDGATGNPAGIPAALGRYAARRRVRTRQVQLVSWAASAALHLPDGPAAQRRDASLPGTPRDLAWIHGYDVFAPATGRGARCSAAAGSPSTRPA